MILTEEDLEIFEHEEESELVIHQPTLFDYFREDAQTLNENIILYDDERWEKGLELFAKAKKIAFDTETYGAEPWHPLWFKKNRIRLLQVGLVNGWCLMADLGGWLENADPNYKKVILERYEKFLAILKDKLFDPEVIVVGVNLKFDATTIRQHFGFILRQARDLMILSQVYWAGVGVEKAKAGENRSERCKLSHGLKGIAQRFGYEIDKTEQSSNWGWSLSNSQLNYAADDVIVVLKIFDDFKPLIKEAGLAYTAFVECNCVSVFAEMEFKGVPVNLELAQEELEKYEKKIAEFVDIFESHFPGVQWSSNVQVLEAFENGIEGFNKLFGADETPNVSAETLHQISHPAAKALLEARRLTTGANNIRGFIDNSFDGNIRGFYRQIAPGGSGRSTCSAKLTISRRKYTIGAQLQNPPNAIRAYKGELKGVRELIQAPPGYKFGVFDGAQMHMRIAAELSQDPLLLRIFKDDFDGHSILAAKLSELEGLDWSAEFISGTQYKGPRDAAWKAQAETYYNRRSDTTMDKVTWLKWAEGQGKSFRNVAKTMLYSSLNGSTRGRIYQELISIGYTWATLEAAGELVKFFNESYPKLTKFIRDQHNKANETSIDFSGLTTFDGQAIEGLWGRVECLSGRHIYFKKYPNKFRRGELQVSYTDATAANWLPVEANMIKHWVVEIYNEFCNHPEWEAYIGNLPHDEVNIVCKEEYANVVSEMIYNKMKEVFGKWLKSIPAVEEMNPHKNMVTSWAEK